MVLKRFFFTCYVSIFVISLNFSYFRQLSDITRDGALSLAEFKIAMHLVVLKRNGIALPSALPPSLVYTVPVTIPSPSPSNAELSLSPQSKGKEASSLLEIRCNRCYTSASFLIFLNE